MKQEMEQGVLRHCGKLAALAAATLAMADAATNPPARPAKTMRVMAIGNSFSRDALTHLPFIVEAAGHRLVSANAIILGGSLEDHAKALEAFDADPSDRAQPVRDQPHRRLLRAEYL